MATLQPLQNSWTATIHPAWSLLVTWESSICPLHCWNLWHSPTNSQHHCQHHKPMHLTQNILNTSISSDNLPYHLSEFSSFMDSPLSSATDRLSDLPTHSFERQNEGELIALFKNQTYNMDLIESYLNITHAVISSSEESCIPAFPIHYHKWVIAIINILASWKECTSTLQLKYFVQRCLFFHRHLIAI